ncbi:hypothetical protein ERJ75_000849700 [Trypanosoma vivax]|nr:hypothetical protein ERJ75_000849700 [Trypanosoma vivax]
MRICIVMALFLANTLRAASAQDQAVRQNTGKPDTAIRTADAQLICRLSAAFKHTINTSTALMERAFDVEAEVLEKMRSAESSLRLAIGEVVKALARLRKRDGASARLEAELQLVEDSVNAARRKRAEVCEKVSQVVLRAIALSAKAGAFVGAIDDFIAVFESANSHQEYRCITTSGDSYIKIDGNAAATLITDLKGCTWEHYGEGALENVSAELVRAVGQIGHGVLVKGMDGKGFSAGNENCPFLVSDFVQPNKSALEWGGLWRAVNNGSHTRIEWKNNTRYLTEIVNEFGLLASEFSDVNETLPGVHRGHTTLQQLVGAFNAALKVTLEDGKAAEEAQKAAAAIMRKAQTTERDAVV